MPDDRGIPAWQRRAAEKPQPPQPAPAPALAPAPAPAPEDKVVDQVREFLHDGHVKDASPEKKRAFLLSKNVPEDVVDKLMAADPVDTAGSTDAANARAHKTAATDGEQEAASRESDAGRKTPHAPAYTHTADGSQDAAHQEADAPKTAATSSAPFSPAEFRLAASSGTSRGQQPRRDVPPVITYPEFLVQRRKPPPLVTVNRLVNTAYVFGALSASIYALSRYIIAPMSENLTEARHDLAHHAHDRVQHFNTRLSGLVSTVPSSAKSQTLAPDDSDAESTASDPTELFHRDVGTQTSPSLSRRPSLSSPDAEPDKPDAVVAKHVARLDLLRSHLSEILSDDQDIGTLNRSLQTGVADVRQLVDSLYYSSPGFQYQQADNAWNQTATAKTEKSDAAAAFKAEIRGVKGVLLSAKRFPSAAKVGA